MIMYDIASEKKSHYITHDKFNTIVDDRFTTGLERKKRWVGGLYIPCLKAFDSLSEEVGKETRFWGRHEKEIPSVD